MLFFKFKNYSCFINDSSLLFCILIFNRSVLKIKQFSLDLYNQKLANKETYKISRVDVNTIAFNHASILAYLLLSTLTTKYILLLQIIFYYSKFIRVWNMLFISLLIFLFTTYYYYCYYYYYYYYCYYYYCYYHHYLLLN